MAAQTDLLSGHQAAHRLGLPRDRVQDLAHQGKLPALRTPLGWLYRKAGVDGLARRRAARAAGRRGQPSGRRAPEVRPDTHPALLKEQAKAPTQRGAFQPEWPERSQWWQRLVWD